MEITLKDREIALKGEEITLKDREIALKGEEITLKDHEIVQKGEEIKLKDRDIEVKPMEIALKDREIALKGQELELEVIQARPVLAMERRWPLLATGWVPAMLNLEGGRPQRAPAVLMATPTRAMPFARAATERVVELD
jgi:hypothetical protein